MKKGRFDVLALGNAIVDVLARIEEDFLLRERLIKGSMSLIEEDRATALLSKMLRPLQVSGGSAANTAVGVSSLGGTAAFSGKVKNDALGKEYKRDLQKSGVHFSTAPSMDGPSTARSMVFVTPDGERTMATYLGACRQFSSTDVEDDLIKESSIIYLEGYLWDPPGAKDAFRLASKKAHQAGRLVALSLSDSFCVERFRNEFLELLTRGHIDILFANRHEIASLWQTSDLETALESTCRLGITSIVTNSEEGCTIFHGQERFDVSAYPVDQVVDATGAGDLFAAGFLTGLCKGVGLADCGRLGALAASEAITHFGARPKSDLREIARGLGLIS